MLEAERSGALEPERVASWRKLQRELQWLAAKQDQRVRAERDARWRVIHRAQRARTQRSPKR